MMVISCSLLLSVLAPGFGAGCGVRGVEAGAALHGHCLTAMLGDSWTPASAADPCPSCHGAVGSNLQLWGNKQWCSGFMGSALERQLTPAPLCAKRLAAVALRMHMCKCNLHAISASCQTGGRRRDTALNFPV